MALHLTRLLAAAVVGFALLGVAPLRAQQLPKAEDLLDKYVQVTGGKAAHEKIKSLIAKGTISFMGIKGEMTSYHKAPNLLYIEIKLPGIGTITSGYDGKVAWENNPLEGAKLLKGSKLDEMIRESSLDGDANWRRHYKSVKTVEEVQIDGKPAYRVDLVSNGGVSHSRFYDKETGLVVKMKHKVDGPMGELDIEEFISDYKKIDGMLTPTKVRQALQQIQIEINFTQFEPNVNIPDDRFALPKEVKDLLKQT